MNTQSHRKTHRAECVHITHSHRHTQAASHTPFSSQELFCFDRSSFTTARGYNRHHYPVAQTPHSFLSAVPPHPASLYLPPHFYLFALSHCTTTLPNTLLLCTREILPCTSAVMKCIFLHLIQSQNAGCHQGS